MKKYLVMSIGLLFLGLGVNSLSAEGNPTNQAMIRKQGGVQWSTNYEDSLQKAKKENKPILLFFTGSNWCGWCKKIDQEVFQSPDFSSQVGNSFVFVEIDFPTNAAQTPELAQQNKMLKEKFGITGFPTIVILDPNGTFVAETGYRAGGGKAYADYLSQFLK